MPKASANVSRGPEVTASTASSVLRDAPVVIHQLTVTRVHLKKHRWIVKILVEDLKMTKLSLRLIDGSVTISFPVSVGPLSLSDSYRVSSLSNTITSGPLVATIPLGGTIPIVGTIPLAATIPKNATSNNTTGEK